VQRTCRLTSVDPISCYFGTKQSGLLANTPFNHIDSDTPDGKFMLLRSAGLMTGSSQYTPAASTCDNAEDSPSHVISGQWWAPSMTALYGQGDMLSPTDCRWKTNMPGYLREVTARSTLDPATAVTHQYDYSYEVCSRPGDCTEGDFECINAYTIVGVGNPADVDARNLIGFTSGGSTHTYYPRQYPTMGSGTIDSVYAKPVGGPYWPCPVNESSGRQLACSDDPNDGLAMSLDLYVTIGSLKVKRVTKMSYTAFSVLLEYEATWTSRYAVHPCTINLYDDGAGVGAKGKVVSTEGWWLPSPKGDGATSTSVKHSEKLKVLHTPDLRPWRAPPRGPTRASGQSSST
jgi:hypothetical protein